MGALHFLALVGLTGALMDRKISNWSKWLTPLALTIWMAVTVVFAAAVAIGYDAL